MARQHFDVTQGPLLKKTLLYTIPIILTSILQLLFNAADLIVVGSVSETYVAAVGATGSITNLVVNLFIGLGSGISVVTAQSIGARDYKATQSTVHTAIPLAILGGAFLTAVGIFIATPMLKAMGTPDDVIGYSALYMKLYFCGMIPNLIYNFGAAILRATGDTKGPLYYLTIAGIINVVLNLIFVKVFDMTVDGVAIATVISQSVSAVLVLNALIKRVDACRLDLKSLRIDKNALGQILKIGVPAGLQSSLYSIANVMIQTAINSFGSAAMAGNAAAGNAEGFGYVAINSFYHTALNFTGQNIGAKKYDRIKKVYAINLACVLGAGAIVAFLYGMFGKNFIALYNVTDSVGVSFGMTRLMFVAMPYFLCGIVDVTTGVVRGMGSSILPMLNSVIGICGVRLLWVFTVFKALHTPEILFVAYPISWGVTFVSGFIICLIVYRRTKKMEA